MTALATPPTPARATSRLAAIDGLRGFALLGMLAWHAELGWVKGGFARMTIFFVLSGYLAAASLLAARERHGDGHVRAFWWRRARRLLPVSLLGVALATAVAVVLGGEAGAGLRGDATSVLLNVSNWRFVLAGQSYGALFERPSPFQHFWSLSLEEQLFWVLPLVLVGVVAVARHRAWLATAALAAGLGAIPLFVAHSPDAAYYGTHVRAAEFLAGVALALLLHRHGSVPERARPALRWLGAASLATLVLVMLLVDRNLPWLYQGGLALFAIPAVLVVVAALDARGPVSRVLSLPPLVAIGVWAFPIYVLHWPLFLLLTPERTGLSGAVLVVVQLAVAIGLGALVHHTFERPLMQAGRATGGTAGSAAGTAAGGPVWARRWGDDRVAGRVLVGATVVLGLVAVLVPVRSGVYDFSGDEERANEWAAEAVHDVGIPVGLFGGSTAVMLGAALWDWAPSSPHVRAVPGSSRLGCGLLTQGERVYARDPATGGPAWAPADEHCLDWPDRWPQAVDDGGLDVAFVLGGVWDTADWLLPDDDRWRAIGDPAIDAILRAELERSIDLLNGRGAHVVLATTPLVGGGATGTAREDRWLGDDHPHRVGRYNQLVREVADQREWATVVDYGGFVDGLDPERSASWLPDGIHPTPDAAVQIWRDFLGPEVEVAALQAEASRDRFRDEPAGSGEAAEPSA
jgi:peptidoglycan/LPS O-acetylase OafA/YrhL